MGPKDDATVVAFLIDIITLIYWYMFILITKPIVNASKLLLAYFYLNLIISLIISESIKLDNLDWILSSLNFWIHSNCSSSLTLEYPMKL